MINIIVAFSNPQDGKTIRNALVRKGFSVNAVCTSGFQALSLADGLGWGILVCGFRFGDMMFEEIHDCLPPGFSTLLVAPGPGPGQLPGDVVCLGLPLKVHDLASTLEMMVQTRARQRKRAKSRLKERSKEEQEMISQAKAVLMERNHMTEMEAHHYIQKCSMDSGANMVETAQMIMGLANG